MSWLPTQARKNLVHPRVGDLPEPFMQDSVGRAFADRRWTTGLQVGSELTELAEKRINIAANPLAPTNLSDEFNPSTINIRFSGYFH